MILVALAAAADPEYDRLFGPETAEAAQEAEPAEPGLPPWFGPFAIAGLGLAAYLWFHKPRPGSPAESLKVVARQPLGDRSAVVLLEVTGSDGEVRRLLVGTGSGAPSLVADLGGRFEVEDEPAAAPNVAEELLAERRSRGRTWAVVGDDE